MYQYRNDIPTITNGTREGYQKSEMSSWYSSVSDLNNDIVNLPNTNELGEEEEEQRKQAEKVWVKALAPKAF